MDRDSRIRATNSPPRAATRAGGEAGQATTTLPFQYTTSRRHLQAQSSSHGQTSRLLLAAAEGKGTA